MPKSTGVFSLVQGTLMRIAELRSQPANISLAVSPPATPRRIVEPSPDSTTTTGDNGVAAATAPTAATPRLLNTRTKMQQIPKSRRPKSSSEASLCLIDKAVPHQLIHVSAGRRSARPRASPSEWSLSSKLKVCHWLARSKRTPVCSESGFNVIVASRR